MATLTRPMSYEEWLQMPPVEDGTDEVVNGELRLMPPTRYPHAEIIQRLINRLSARIDEKQVAILGSNFGLMISREPLTCRSPDLALFKRQNITVKDGLYWSPPDLIIEILSPSETKRRKDAKLDDYARIGVPEAWLISPEGETIEIRLLHDGRLVTEKIVAGGALEPTRFPGVAISIPEIWPDDLD
jgi:Uma2 family endonuclease